MSIVHNVILRGLNSIYVQAPYVSPNDYGAFIGYSLAWHEVLEFHHHGEETLIFPGIDKAAGEKGVMEVNVAQHGRRLLIIYLLMLIAFALSAEFHPGLDAFKEYLLSVKGSPSKFSGAHLNSLIDSFAPLLTAHLTAEIPTLLSLSRFGDKIDVEELFDKDGKLAMTIMGKTTGVVFWFLNLDTTFEGGQWANWPPTPAPIRWVITRLLALPNRAYWKFASCDATGTPKALHAVPS